MSSLSRSRTVAREAAFGDSPLAAIRSSGRGSTSPPRGTAAQRREAQLQTLLELARTSYASSHWKVCAETSEKAYALDAACPANLLMLGAAHFQLKNYSESIFYNQQAVRVDPSFAEAYGNLGNALKALGDLEGAISAYTRATKLKPRFADAYSNLASAYALQGNTAHAVETYKVAIVLNPELADAHANLGNVYKAQGDLPNAKRCFMNAIRINPEFAVAWSNLGGVFRDQGDAKTAVAYYNEALRLAPSFADAYSNLGNALRTLGKVREAKKAYEKAIQLRPDFAVAHSNLGACYFEIGNAEKAIRLCKSAIQLDPSLADAYSNLGNVLRSVLDLDGAIGQYRVALRINPRHVYAYINLGNALKDKGLVKEALHCFGAAAKLMPTNAHAHSNLASLLKEQGRVHESLKHFAAAVRADPGLAEAHCNMGSAFAAVGENERAIECFKEAIKNNETMAPAYACLGTALRSIGRWDDAVKCFSKALELSPDGAPLPHAVSELAYAECMTARWENRAARFKQLTNVLYAELQEAERTERGLAAQAEASAAAAASSKKHRDAVDAGSAGVIKEGDEASHWGATAAGSKKPRFYGVRNSVCVQPFHTQMYGFPLEMVRRVAASWAAASRRAVALATAGHPPFRFRAKRPHDRFRIGYISAGFGDHPTGRAVVRLLHVHDRRRFEVFAYALAPPDNSTVWKATARAADHLKDLSAITDVAEVASIIHTDGIHILIDLDGYCSGARPEIFAMAPAPLAISWAPGYNATTGASPDHVHYLVGDPVATPLKSAPFYSEKILLLPQGTSRALTSHRPVVDADGAAPAVVDLPAARVHGEGTGDSAVEAAERPSRSEFGLPEQKFVFACFSSIGKMDPALFRAWCRIVRRVPNALLWLLEFPPAAKKRLQAFAKEEGMKPHNLVFSPVVPRNQHLLRIGLADLVLDTPTSNGCSTVSDCLWAATPVLTQIGQRMSSRIAASMLHAAGIPECVTHSLEEYENLAVALASDQQKLWLMRHNLENTRGESPLFDTVRTARAIEEGMHHIWERYASGLEPAHYEITERTSPKYGAARKAKMTSATAGPETSGGGDGTKVEDEE